MALKIENVITGLLLFSILASLFLVHIQTFQMNIVSLQIMLIVKEKV